MLSKKFQLKPFQLTRTLVDKPIRFSLNDPVSRVKEYTTMLKKDFGPKIYSDDMINFFIKYIVCSYTYDIPISSSILDDYLKIDPNFIKSDSIRSSFDDMNLLKPFLYSQMINPKFYKKLLPYYKNKILIY